MKNKSIHASAPKYVFQPFRFYSSKILMTRISSYSFLALFPPCLSWKGNLCPYLLSTVSQIRSPEWRFLFVVARLKALHTRSPICKEKVSILPRLGLQTFHCSTFGRRKGTDFQVTGLDWPKTETSGNFSNLWLGGAESFYLPVICTD